MSYKSTYPNRVSIINEIETDDINLTELFAFFIEMTRQIGYPMGSYKNILKELQECVNENYPIDSWASDIMCEHASREKEELWDIAL